MLTLDGTKYKGITSNDLVKSSTSEDERISVQYKLDDDGAPIQIIIDYGDDNKSIYTITYVE